MSRFSGWNLLLVFQILLLACGETSVLAAKQKSPRDRRRARTTSQPPKQSQGRAKSSQPPKQSQRRAKASPPPKQSQRRAKASAPPKQSQRRAKASPPPKQSQRRAKASQPPKQSQRRAKASPPPKQSQRRAKASPPPKQSQRRAKTSPPPKRSQRRTKTSQPPKQSRTSRRTQPQATGQRQDHTQNEPILMPSIVYKSAASREEVTLDFADTGFQWPQPDGPGTAVTITYSFSNLLDGDLMGLSVENAKFAVEEALTLWSEVAPIHFVEIADQGPLPTGDELAYRASNHPQIRFGHHHIDGKSGGALAHAYLPFSTREGLAGDIHFDRDESWNQDGGGLFLETALHEVGHALGLDHEVESNAIMNPIIQNRFDGLGVGYLLEDDIAGIRNLYGSGNGSVSTLNDPANDSPDEDPGADTGDQETPTEQEPFGVLATLDSRSRTLSIIGDHQANAITVISIPWFVAVIGTSDTPVNGQPGSLFFFSPRGTITCNLGSGDDTVTCFRLKSRTLECELGAGDDTLSLLFCSIRHLLASGETGNDELFRLGCQIKNFGHAGFEQIK